MCSPATNQRITFHGKVWRTWSGGHNIYQGHQEDAGGKGPSITKMLSNDERTTNGDRRESQMIRPPPQ